MSSGSDDGTGKKKKGPNQKQKHRGDPFDNSTARLQQFIESNERYIEWRTIFDGLPNHAALKEELSNISEDFEQTDFFSVALNA